MINNDVLRSVRFMLKVDDAKLAAIIKLGGGEVTRPQVTAFLKKEDEPGFVPCANEVMGWFLDGLIIHRSGPPPPSSKPRPPEKAITNNTVLKKLRVAFELKDEDVLALMASTGFQVSKPELSALFRTPTHPNFRPCGDQFLRNFLKGLTERVREVR
jgi:uncharacterized protein YehS (DUF1456 family)